MKLMNGEEILFESSDYKLTLSTHRIRFQSTEFGSKNMISFLLEELDSCAIEFESFPVLLISAGIVAVLSILLSIFSNIPTFAVFASGLVMSGTLILIYFYSRESVLRISSKSSSIRYSIKSRAFESIVKLIDEIELAKYECTQIKNHSL